VVGFLAGLGGLLLVAVGPGHWRQPKVVLPDGSRITLRAVTWGTRHFSPPRQLTWLSRQLPQAWRSRLGLSPGLHFVSPEPRPCFWFVIDSPPDRPPLTSSGLLDNLRLVDDLGVEHPSTRWFACSAVDSGRVLQGLSPPVYPRRPAFLRLRFDWPGPGADRDPAGGRLRPFEFRVANPSRGDWPTWTAARLPVSRSLGTVEFTLAGLVIEVRPPRAEATACFCVAEDGVASPDWRVAEIDLRDATGNRARLGVQGDGDRIPMTPLKGQEGAVAFPWPLWLDEPAYRLRVEFVRRPDARFPPEDALEVRTIPVPGADGVSRVDVRTQLHGVEVGLLALVGEHATLVGREHDVFGQTTLEMDVPPLPEDLRFDVARVCDDQGRAVELLPWTGSQSYGLRIPEGARAVDLKVAVTRRRVVEFFVKPDVRRVPGGPDAVTR
jgi:hypothetical protein